MNPLFLYSIINVKTNKNLVSLIEWALTIFVNNVGLKEGWLEFAQACAFAEGNNRKIDVVIIILLKLLITCSVDVYVSHVVCIFEITVAINLMYKLK